MTIQELFRRGASGREIARTLEVSEGSVRYHLRRQREGAVDGRSKQTHLAAKWHDKIADWLKLGEEQDEAINLAELHDWLIEECSYSGSLRSLERYVAARFARPRLRARRRVETPPGAQAQADWAEWPAIRIRGREVYAYQFHLRLSFSRFAARVWSPPCLAARVVACVRVVRCAFGAVRLCAFGVR